MKKVYIVLEDGHVFEGERFGAEGEVIGEFFATLREGVDRVNPDIKIFDYTWDGDSLEARFDVIDHLPERVGVESISEARIPYEIGGVEHTLHDYSLNIIGPGERSIAMWKRAKERGLETIAKVQINTTWECSTVPALPVLDKVDKMMSRYLEEGGHVTTIDRYELMLNEAKKNIKRMGLEDKIKIIEDKNGYEIEQIIPFDMFPNTTSVETLVKLKLKN